MLTWTPVLISASGRTGRAATLVGVLSAHALSSAAASADARNAAALGRRRVDSTEHDMAARSLAVSAATPASHVRPAQMRGPRGPLGPGPSAITPHEGPTTTIVAGPLRFCNGTFRVAATGSGRAIATLGAERGRLRC